MADGNLVLTASRAPKNKVHTGIVSSKNTVVYPVYIEANIKVANQVLSSNLWLLSPDSKRELDIVEIYAGDRNEKSEQFFAARAASNYHVFLRDPKNNSILKDLSASKKHLLPNQERYRHAYHRFGAYWKGAWNVDFYIDGQLVRRLTKDELKDPDGLGLDRPMHIILDIEDHDWRSKKGIVASDEELADETKNKMYIDWIRVYKPVK